MRFSKLQKSIVKSIFNGEIYDILSYIKVFKLGEYIQFNKEEVIQKFKTDNIEKEYFYPRILGPKLTTIYSHSEYQNKLKAKEINPEEYKKIELQLDFNEECRVECWNDMDYEFNFYQGVYITKSFQDILDFLTLWEHLKSEMLIFEIPSALSSEVLGLFYKKEIHDSDNSSVDRLKLINFDSFTYGDTNYLKDSYEISTEHCLMFQNYLGKRIYPTTKLGIFINKRFRTSEEATQNKALMAAWLAILVTILLAIIPEFGKSDTAYLKNISNDIHDIRVSINNDNFQNDSKTKLDAIIEQLTLLNTQENSP